MNDARLAESAVSIVVNMYTGILQGIPNLINILTEHKESSYYHDIVAKDIEFTQNAVTIASDDNSARYVEIKLQEKGIPFDKMPSSLLEDHIKANGRHVFLARECDYERITEAVQEIKSELSTKNHDADLEFEDDQELEREIPENITEGEHEDLPSDADEMDSLDEDQEDDQEDDDSEPDKKKEKKTTAKKDGQTYTPQKEPSREMSGRWPDREDRIEGQHAQEREQQRYDDQRKTYDLREQYDREQREQYDQRKRQNQERRETRERELMQEHKPAESPHWESDKKTLQESHPESERERDHRAERANSETANRDKSLNLSTGQFEQGKTTEQLREEENWITQKRSTEPDARRQNLSRPETEQNNLRAERMESTYSCSGAENRLQKEKSREERYQPERSAPACGNKHVNANFGSPHESGIADSEAKAGVTVLGTGHDVVQAKDQVSESPQRTGSVCLNHTRSRQAEFFSSQQKISDRKKETASTYSKDYIGPEKLQDMYDRAKTTVSDATYGTIQVQRIDMKHLPLDIQQMNYLHNGTKYTGDKEALSSIVGHKDVSSNIAGYTDQGTILQRIDRTKDIINVRRFYQVRDLLSPKNFRNAVSGTKRVISQSVVGRDTEGGRVANEAVDYISPVARLTKGRFLNGGAIEIARTTHCNMDILAAAYATKNNMSLNDAKSELRALRKLDANLIRNGNTGLNLANDGAVMKKITEAYELQGKPASFIGMMRSFDNNKFAEFVSHLNISDELREALLKTPVKDIDILKIDSLIKKYGRNSQDKQLLQMMRAGKIMEHYPGAGSFTALFRRYFTKMIKELGRSSDAGRALGSVINVSRNVYHTYRAGIRLLYTVLRKFKVIDTHSVAAQIIADPGKVLGHMALSKTKNGFSRGVTRLGLQNARSVAKTKRIANHATSALKFLKSPLSPLRNILAKNALVKKMSALASKLGAKIAALAAKAGAVLGWIAVVIIIVLIVIEIFATMPDGSSDNKGVSNYMFVQDTEIMQEIITELTAKNEAFIGDINNAANHRGSYGSTAGLTADENVGFYESGAYNIVFRDAYGNELESSHVDLNNTKTIIAMASKFIPYPFNKPSENASDEEKKAYEDIKQHFKDYCYFLWASTHQISIEEYHPGNSDGIEGAVDNSGLVTSLDRGICDKDGTTIWLQDDFSKNIVRYGKSEWICDSCSDVPATGLGDYYDDLCTHGKDTNPHGGWRRSGNRREIFNCQDDHRHSGCDEDDHYTYTCEELGNAIPASHKHWEYEWVYDCGGHMGSVVYVTIGELSRIPAFGAAGDVDYEAVGKYETGDSIIGSDITGNVSTGNSAFKGAGYILTDEQIRRITALCIQEQGSDLTAIAFEASLIANLTDRGGYGSNPWSVANSNWFASESRQYLTQASIPTSVNGTAVTDAMISTVKNVLVNGNRATAATEHDYLGDIISVTNNGVPFDKNDRSKYISGVTIIKNSMGATYVFECFPSATSDPFGILT